ncbi:MAG: hypothetical protein ACFFDN_24375 [Candidatus Hodarchaeota archaeon]
MASIFSWIKKELVYLKDSFSEIIKGTIFVILASAGLACALLLRYLGYSGTIITFFGVITEFISLILCYFLFRNYLKPEEKAAPSKSKLKKI